MATLTVQTPTYAAPTITFAAVAASDVFDNDGDTLVLVENGSGGNITITATATATPGGLTITNPVTANIADGAMGGLPVLDPSLYNDANGQVTITCSSTSSVTIACVRAK